MKIIKYLVIALLVVPALWLLAFGPRAGEAVPAGFTVVDYWEKWTGDEEQKMRDIVDEFNKTVGKDKKIFVRFVSTTGIDRKTLLATAAGVPPDIAGLWDQNIVQYATQDALEPLDDLAKEFGIGEDTYKPVYWRNMNYDGHLYALVSTPAAIALHYNTKLFAKNADKLRAAGLDPTRAPQTIAELDAYAKALDETKGNHIDRLGYLPAEPGWYNSRIYLWFGGDIFDFKTQKFTLTSPEVVQSYAWIQGYSKRLGNAARNEFSSSLGTFASNQNAFLTDTVVMEQQGPWMANFIRNLNPKMSTVKWPTLEEELKHPLNERLENHSWAVAPFPSNVPGMKDVSYCNFDALCIPKGAKNKREAFIFMAYVTRQDIMEKLCASHYKLSPLSKVSPDFIEKHPNPYIGVFERLAASPNAHGNPQIPIIFEVDDELNTLIQKVINLSSEPGAALQEAQDRLQARYDDYMAKQNARRALAGLPPMVVPVTTKPSKKIEQ